MLAASGVVDNQVDFLLTDSTLNLYLKVDLGTDDLLDIGPSVEISRSISPPRALSSAREPKRVAPAPGPKQSRTACRMTRCWWGVSRIVLS
jgi:hypothetical protein